MIMNKSFSYFKIIKWREIHSFLVVETDYVVEVYDVHFMPPTQQHIDVRCASSRQALRHCNFLDTRRLIK